MGIKPKKPSDNTEVMGSDVVTETPATVGEGVTTDFQPIGEDIQPVNEVVFNPNTKLVKVRTKENHRCCIGGVYYTFEKGVAQNVPANVKDILQSNELLTAL